MAIVKPRPEPEDQIYLGLALDDEGYLYLEDAETGRPIAYQKDIEVKVCQRTDEIQCVEMVIFADSRTFPKNLREEYQRKQEQRIKDLAEANLDSPLI